MNLDWIDANVRPPDLGNILVMFDDGEPGVVCWVDGDSIRHRRIKFWMPFPEVPKPDPFLEWYRRERVQGSHEKEMRSAWDAGVQWQRNLIVHGDDAWKKAPGERE